MAGAARGSRKAGRLAVRFESELMLPGTPGAIWRLLLDVPRVAACVPGCEAVEEETPRERYRALVKQRLGPFRLEAPLAIHLAEAREPERLRAVVSGRDRLTGTSISAELVVTLAPEDAGRTRLGLVTELQVGGRLAALGYSVIRGRAEEATAEFAERLRCALGAG